EPSEDVLTGLLESLSQDGLESVLSEVAVLATEAIPDADGASVASLRDGRATTFAATDERVRALDEAQYSVQNGPCGEAGLDGEVHLSQHLPNDAQWPTLAEAAARQDVGSVLSVPIPNSGKPIGTLNLYARRANAFGKGDARAALGFAKYASYALT